MTVASRPIFGEKIREQIVCLIVNMWNALPRLSLCILWQAVFQLKHKIVGVASALCCVKAHLCRATGSFVDASSDHLTFIWV